MKCLHKNVEWRVKFYLKIFFPESLNFTSYNNSIKTSRIDVLNHILKHIQSSGAKAHLISEDSLQREPA